MLGRALRQATILWECSSHLELGRMVIQSALEQPAEVLRLHPGQGLRALNILASTMDCLVAASNVPQLRMALPVRLPARLPAFVAEFRYQLAPPTQCRTCYQTQSPCSRAYMGAGLTSDEDEPAPEASPPEDAPENGHTLAAGRLKRHNEGPPPPEQAPEMDEPMEELGDGMTDDLADDLDEPGDRQQDAGGGATRRRAAVLEDSDEE